jgi:Zn-dependent protease with chaperone function
VPTLWLLGLSGIAHLGLHNPIVDWCRHLLPEHRPVGAVVGIASLIAALIGTARAVGVLLQHHRLRCTHTHSVEFIDTDEVYAYTLPGPARTIAISDGLRNSLDDHEFDVVLAHERSHARNRHDRFKLLGLVTTAFVPPVTRLVSRLDYYLERWADEDALRDTGIDRRVAARTIAKVALAAASPQPALGIADHGVAARAAALLRPIEQPGITTRVQASLVIAATLALAAYQLHHSAMFAADLVG